MRTIALTSIDQMTPFHILENGKWRLEYRGIAVDAGELELVTASANETFGHERLHVIATSIAYVQHGRALQADAERRLRGYVAHVAKTGEDPLDYFRTRAAREVKERWFVRLRAEGHGLVAESVWQHGGRRLSPERVPQYVADFLELHRVGHHLMVGARSVDEITGCEVRPVAGGRWRVSCLVTVTKPRPAAELRRRRMESARAWLR